MKNWKTEAIILAVGLVVLGAQIESGINNFVDKDRVVTVKGLAEMEVPANKVTWPLMYKEVGNDLSTLYNKISNTNKTIVDFPFEVGHEFEKDKDGKLVLYLELDLPDPLPDVKPEGGSSSGFDATVEDWGDEIEHEIEM